MGWSYGTNAEGREVGCSVEATCDLAGCDERIDRGLVYVCGPVHGGGEFGCGSYFCSPHRFLPERSGVGFLCERCCAKLDAEGDHVPPADVWADS